MAAAIFLGFFIILGLSVVGVAMRGGPRGVRDTLEALPALAGALGAHRSIGCTSGDAVR